MARPQITVVTATYNRAPLLRNLYESLVQQTFTAFEWVVVDDGSTDETPDLLVALAGAASFPVQILRQNNAGKHVALNAAFATARGELTATVDSDDQLVLNALATVWDAWTRIPETQRSTFSSVAALCQRGTGTIVGTTLTTPRSRPTFVIPDPANAIPTKVPNVTEFDDYAANHLYRRDARDKWLVHRTDLLRQHPFPVYPGETFLAEGAVWDLLATRYKTRFLDVPLQIVNYQPDGLSTRSLALRAANPIGAVHYYHQLAGLHISPYRSIIARVNRARFAFHALSMKPAASSHIARPAKGEMTPASVVMRPWHICWSIVGFALFAHDRWQFRRTQKNRSRMSESNTSLQTTSPET